MNAAGEEVPRGRRSRADRADDDCASSAHLLCISRRHVALPLTMHGVRPTRILAQRAGLPSNCAHVLLALPS